MADLDYSKAPTADIGAAFERYFQQGIPTGGFLMAVLRNDLKEACGRADMYNRERIVDIVAWLYNHTPMNCWGSPERVNAHLISFAKKDEAESDV